MFTEELIEIFNKNGTTDNIEEVEDGVLRYEFKYHCSYKYSYERLRDLSGVVSFYKDSEGYTYEAEKDDKGCVLVDEHGNALKKTEKRLDFSM